MDYLQMVKQHPQEKLALVDAGKEYTYGDLVQLASKMRAEASLEQNSVFGI